MSEKRVSLKIRGHDGTLGELVDGLKAGDSSVRGFNHCKVKIDGERVGDSDILVGPTDTVVVSYKPKRSKRGDRDARRESDHYGF